MACLLVACHQIGHTGILSFVIGVDINSRLSIHSSLVEGGSIRGPIIVFFFSLDICRISVCRGFFACCWSEDTQPFIIYFPCSEMLAVVYGLERG